MAFVAVVYHAPSFGVVGADDFAAGQDVGRAVPARAGGYGIVCVRVERVQATITEDDIGKGTATNPSSRLEAQAMANCRKVHAGHFLAKNLGGSGGVGHVFPQTPGINTGRYRAFEMHIANKIKDHGSGTAYPKY